MELNHEAIMLSARKSQNVFCLKKHKETIYILYIYRLPILLEWFGAGTRDIATRQSSDIACANLDSLRRLEKYRHVFYIRFDCWKNHFLQACFSGSIGKASATTKCSSQNGSHSLKFPFNRTKDWIDGYLKIPYHFTPKIHEWTWEYSPAMKDIEERDKEGLFSNCIFGTVKILSVRAKVRISSCPINIQFLCAQCTSFRNPPTSTLHN